jgi:hypothetical protein
MSVLREGPCSEDVAPDAPLQRLAWRTIGEAEMAAWRATRELVQELRQCGEIPLRGEPPLHLLLAAIDQAAARVDALSHLHPPLPGASHDACVVRTFANHVSVANGREAGHESPQ